MPWAKSTSPYYGQTLEAITRHYKASMTKPWTELLGERAQCDPLRLGRRVDPHGL